MRSLEDALDKSKAIDAAVSQIERQFGKGSIMRMGDEHHQSVASIPTGALALDLALGVGGVPRGRVVEIFGPESSGKTTLSLHIIKVGTDAVGNQTRVKVVKNKVAPPFKTVEFDVMYGEGISREGSLLDVGIENDVVQKSGAWFAYGEERLGQGRENSKQFLKENHEIRERILDDIYDKLGFNEPVEEVAEGPGVSQMDPRNEGQRSEEPAGQV